MVLGGTTEVELARFLKTLNIRPASVTACGSDALVVLIQGFNEGYMVDNFQRILQSEVPLARIKERVLVHPFIPPDKPRATRN
jgi:hypothetical protein